MSLDNHKITTYEDSVSSLPDYPSDAGYTAAMLKAIFDGRTDKEIKQKFNALIDELISILADLEQADSAAERSAKEHADNAVSGHNTDAEAHSDIRGLISELTRRLNALADSDDTTLDQLSELVAYIKNNRSLIDSVTTAKANAADVYNRETIDKKLTERDERISVLEEAENSMDEKLESYVKKSDFSADKGIRITSSWSSAGTTYTPSILKATTTEIKNFASDYKPIVPSNLECAVDFANAKLGMASKTYVDNAVNEVEAKIPDVSGFATEEQLMEHVKKDELIDLVLAGIPDGDIMSY
ncbi:MAG: hypothetical protein IJ949_06185 [Oscillospiraceae bacterium]|nr:hypothetical protein [Oscillospiraceae bacterium]